MQLSEVDTIHMVIGKQRKKNHHTGFEVRFDDAGVYHIHSVLQAVSNVRVHRQSLSNVLTFIF